MRRATVTVGLPDARTAAASACLRRLEVRGERPDDDEVEGREPLAEAGDVRLAGHRRQEDLLHAGDAAGGAPRPASAEPSTRCRPASGRRASTGRPRSGRRRPGRNGTSRVVVADEGDRPSGQLGGEGLMVDRTRRRRAAAGRSRPASGEARPAGASRAASSTASIRPRRCAWARPSASRSRAASSACPEQHVLAGTEGGDGVHDLGRSLGEGAHVQGIGDGHAVEPQLPAQQVAQDRGGQAGRQVVGQARQREVAGHDHPRARGQRRSKRDELPLRPARRASAPPAAARGADPPPCRRRPGSAWRSRPRRASCRPRTVAAASRPDRLGIVAEAADPERGIGRIVRQVAHRRVVHVDAEGPQLAGHGAGDALRQLLVAGRAERHRARELASSRRPGRPAGRPPGRRRPATAALPPAVPPGSPRSARGSGPDPRRCGHGRASPRRRPAR